MDNLVYLGDLMYSSLFVVTGIHFQLPQLPLTSILAFTSDSLVTGHKSWRECSQRFVSLQ